MGVGRIKNERITENIIRDLLTKHGYRKDKNISIEEQVSSNATIQKLLKTASKSGLRGGRPEFIIRHSSFPDFVIVIECKADKKFHRSESLGNYKDYAVDGVLNYAFYLSSHFNVIAVAASGQQPDDILISNFLWVKGANKHENLIDKHKHDIVEILSFENYINAALYDHRIEKARFENLISFSKDLHNYMRDYAKISETEKPLLVSGVLIALLNNAFSKNYKHYDQKNELADELLDAIRREINKATIPQAKKESILQPYSFINVHPELKKVNKNAGETPLYRLICDIDEHVKPFIQNHGHFDVLGHFYGEFLRYTGGDKKGLGIVLTPKHLTDLFAKLANLTVTSVVLDICAGTGGFLISAMYEMFKKASNEDEREKIKRDCLYGIEQQPNMFALGASNMILRGDGKANLYQGNCFDTTKYKHLKNLADVGMINPPYSQKGEDLHELNFIQQMLFYLKKGGVGLAVVPISCAISPHPMKESILKEHRLDAVMSLPSDIFSPIGTVTCIMVFTAHVPHEQNSYHKTWFGYWRDDGFIKTKHKGRIDGGRWPEIEREWLDSYFNRREIPGFCVNQKVTAQDEWCAEAYMETDYSNLSQDDFEKELKKYVVFNILNRNGTESSASE